MQPCRPESRHRGTDQSHQYGTPEADHDDHSPAERAHVRALAASLGLVATGSSDFHGANKTVRLGANTTDPGVYAAIVAAASGYAPLGEPADLG